MFIEISTSLFLLTLSLIAFFLVTKHNKSKQQLNTHIPKSYPLVGSYFAVLRNFSRRVQWTIEIIQNSPSATFVLQKPLFCQAVITGNPANIQHVLMTHFHLYQKGSNFRDTLFDMLGNGIFNVDGDSWKFQRQVASHEFNTKSPRKFVETVVDTELSDRLIPILATAAENKTVLDLQDVLQRFAFDNICKIAFGYDPACLLLTTYANYLLLCMLSP